MFCRLVIAVFLLCGDMATAAASDVLMFGATRNTGLETAKLLVGRGDAVTAFVRQTSDVAALEELGVSLVLGDALDTATAHYKYLIMSVNIDIKIFIFVL